MSSTAGPEAIRGGGTALARVYRIENFPITPAAIQVQETLFHNANGYLGVRGTLEEGVPAGTDTMRGTYINGFYDIVPMKQAEKLYGLVEDKESMLNAADAQTIRFTLEGERFSMAEGRVLEIERALDMDAGTTLRRVVWRSSGGREAEFRFVRMASFDWPSLFTIDCAVTPLNFSGKIEIESTHCALVRNYSSPDDPRLGEGGCYLHPDGQVIDGDMSFLAARTGTSGLALCSGVAHDLSLPADARIAYDEARHEAAFRFSLRLEQGQTLRLTKYAVFCDSIRESDPLEASRREMARSRGRIDEVYRAQREYLARFWESAEVSISGNDGDDRSMQFNLYQLLQAAGRDGKCSIAAKGLSGEGYEGHYFWDTEMYMMPFFTLAMPNLARKLLGYRYAILDKARENARILGHKKGALYPWRTIAGRECGGYFPSGTAQYHIDGDIAYAVAAYYLATGDLDYLKAQGAEILLETARLWIDVGCWYKGNFRINDVTGPDEYTCIVNNNYYTNACAHYNLRWAVKAAEILKTEGAFDAWAARLNVAAGELEGFTKAADAMFLPYDEGVGINPQDDSFLQKPVWDLAATPAENHPLLMHYHPLHLYRYQVCKQADTVLAYCLFDGIESPEVMRRSFEYYEKITTHDSSLSNCIFSIAACRLGLKDKALSYFGDSLGLDLLNTHHNTKDGVHTANMGGCYMAVVQGFAGLRIGEDGPSLDPFLPEKWTGYRFRFQYRGSRLQFAMDKAGASVTLLEGSAVRLRLKGAWAVLDRPGAVVKG